MLNRPMEHRRKGSDTMRSMLLGLLMIMATAAGCATARNTLAQDLGWER